MRRGFVIIVVIFSRCRKYNRCMVWSSGILDAEVYRDGLDDGVH